MKDLIFLALMEAHAAHLEQARKGFQQLNLTESQPKVLYILKDREGCVQKQLAELCKIKQSSMTVLLDKMEKAGYIRRKETKVSGGKRAYQVELTELGKNLSEKVTAVVQDLEDKSFMGVSEEEKMLLFSLLDRVTENLRRNDSCDSMM